MSTNIASQNPVVDAIISGKAPQPARLAAARGLLPLAQADLLEILVALRGSDDGDIATAAQATLETQDNGDLLIAAQADSTSGAVLAYLAIRGGAPRNLQDAVIHNPSTPDEAIVALAGQTPDGSLLESIAVNQQRLIRASGLIDAILANPARTAEAERRARETRHEFFEKERGARQIAEELKARGKHAAAEFFETAELTTAAGGLSLEEAWLIAEHIEVSDSDIDDSWLPFERFEELAGETLEQQDGNAKRIIDTERLEVGEVSAERITLIRKIMFMSVKDRVKLAMKGDREARSILVRDSNKTVASAVMHNPRTTDQEAEAIAAMRAVSDEVLRLIALNRAWARQYPIIHNLVRNPRTPIPTVISILPRIRSKDLENLTQNRNVSDAVRRQAMRLSQARTGA